MISFTNYTRALFLAPHTDDVELGCGATLARMVDVGVDVTVAAFSTAKESLPEDRPDQLRDEFYTAMARVGVAPSRLHVYDYPVRKLSYHRQDVLERLVDLQRSGDFDIVFLPSGHDLHQDHQVLYAEGTRCFKHGTILGYELPWNHITFDAQFFIEVSAAHLEQKWNAMQAYESQFEKARSYFSRDFMFSLAQVRGEQIRKPYAEAFELVRMVLKL